MTINLQINQAKQNITDAINNSNLPISIIRMIVDKIADEVREAEYNILQQEAKREQEERERERKKAKADKNEDAEDVQ